MLMPRACSIRIPDHGINHELQQRHPGRGPHPHNRVVVHSRQDQVSGAEAVESVR